jgi:hypothetical protein
VAAPKGADGVVALATKLLSNVAMSERRRGTYNTAKQKEFRKKLRNSMTAAECVLWQSLKGRQLFGQKFRPNQHRSLHCRLLLCGSAISYRA